MIMQQKKTKWFISLTMPNYEYEKMEIDFQNFIKKYPNITCKIQKLNVLIYPMLSVNNLNADSNYIIIKQLCNELLKTKKYNFFLLIDSNRKYVKDDLNSLVKILKVPMPRSKKHQVIHFNSNIFREIFKKYAFDIIWNNVVEQGHHLKYFPDTIVDAFRPKVFNYHHYVIHRSLERVTNYLPCTHILYDQIVGSLGNRP